MKEFELELAALRKRRHSFSLVAWLRRFRPFDRRAMRDPDARDDYWVRVHQRLADSDASVLMRHRSHRSADTEDR